MLGLLSQVLPSYQHLTMLEITYMIRVDAYTDLMETWPEFFVNVAKLPRLNSLVINKAERFPGVTLRSLVNLRYLYINGCASVTVEDLLCLPNLNDLRMNDMEILDLRRLTNLDTLSLTHTFDLKRVYSLPTSLTCLNIMMNDEITEADITHLANLRVLSLTQTPNISDNALRYFTQLEELDIRGARCQITDEGICSLPSLRLLRVDSDSHVTDSAVSRLVRLDTLLMDNASPSDHFPLTLSAKPYLNIRTYQTTLQSSVSWLF